MPKLSVRTVLASFKKLSNRIHKSRSTISRSDASSSFGSSTTTSSSSSSIHRSNTPRSVIPLCPLASNKIAFRELEDILRRLSPDPPSDDEIALMRDEIGGPDGLLDLAVAGPGDELRDAFAVFDADGDGRISAEELLGVFVAIGDERCTIDDCRRMIGGVDSDGDGFVCFRDFARMMDRNGC